MKAGFNLFTQNKVKQQTNKPQIYFFEMMNEAYKRNRKMILMFLS